MVILSILLSTMSLILSIYIVTYSLIQDKNITNIVFKNSFQLAFSKKEQKNAILETTKQINFLLRQDVKSIVKEDDNVLMAELNISDKEVKNFKDKLNKILEDDDYVFISSKSLEKGLKERRTFNLLNLLVNNTKLFSNDRTILYFKYTEYIMTNNHISEKQYKKKFQEIGRMTQSQIKEEISKYNSDDKLNKYVIPSIVVSPLFKNNNVKSIYAMSIN